MDNPATFIPTTLDKVEQAILEEVSGNSRITDFGIGAYEYWGAKGFDSQIGVEIDTDSVSVDVTGLDVIVPNEFKLTLTLGGGGDPEGCLERGRTNCGGCKSCTEYEKDFTAVLKGLERKDGKVLAHFNIR
jgi:hypothetical protein